MLRALAAHCSQGCILASDEPSSQRFGEFILIRLLGTGGMGNVFLAEHAGLQRQVALKLLRESSQEDPTHLVRFRREAEIASRLSHPALPKIYDFGEINGIPYIAMEYVPGQTLADRLAAGGPLPARPALKLVRELLEVLKICHEAGLVHRDIKPSNIMIDERGAVRLLDLGLAKTLGCTSITATGNLVGTPRYLPPEALDRTELDARADLYQLGLVLYECLAGRPAFDASLVGDVMLQVARGPQPLRPAEPSADADLATEFLDRVLIQEPERRFQSCAAAIAFLDRPRARRPTRTVAARVEPRPPPGGQDGDAARLPRRTGNGPGAVAWFGRRPVLALVAVALVSWAAARMSRPGPTGSPRPAPDPVPLVRFLHGSWEVSWRTGSPGLGMVEVTTAPGSGWRRFPEEQTTCPDHRVRFRCWPSPGGRLSFRTRVGAAPPGPVRPLEVPGADQPHDFGVDVEVESVTVRWNTAGAVVGAVRVDGPGIVTRDQAPCQSHALRIERLAPDVEHRLQVPGRDGKSLAVWRGAVPSLGQAADGVIQGIGPLVAGDYCSRLANEYLGASGSPDRIRQLRDAWRARCRALVGGRSFARALALYERARARIFEPGAIDRGLRSLLIHRIEQLRDLHFLSTEAFGVDAGLDFPALKGPGNETRPALPPGYRPALALVFGDGGHRGGRASLTPDYNPVQVAPPALFNDLGHELLSGSSLNPASRSDFRQPGPLLARPPGRAFLGFRIAGGTVLERLLISICPEGADPRGREAASIRGQGKSTVQEGYIQLDERLLADPGAALLVEFYTRGGAFDRSGITLDHMVLYVDGAGR